MTTEYVSNFRVDTDEKGFITLRTGDRNEAPDSDLIASVWNDDFLPLLVNAPALLVLAVQYKNDLRYPITEDSRARRIAAIDEVLAKVMLHATPPPRQSPRPALPHEGMTSL